MLARSGACPALSGRESTARTLDGIVREVVVGSGLEVTVREQQRRVRLEKGEGEMVRNDTCAQNLFGTLEPCVYVHTHEDVCGCAQTHCATEKCACDRWVYALSRRTHCSRYYMVRNRKKTGQKKLTFITPWPSWQKKSSIRCMGSVSVCTEPLNKTHTSSFHVRLDLSCWYLFHQLAFHQLLWVEASRFPEACVSEWPTLLISWFSMLPSYGLFQLCNINTGHLSSLRIITTFYLLILIGFHNLCN